MHLDINKSGSLTAQEFHAALQRLNIDVDPRACEALVMKYDRDGNGLVFCGVVAMQFPLVA